MENFDFRRQEKHKVLFIYKLSSKKFIFSNILGNLLLSVFIITYIYIIFTLRKNFMKYMMIILELFNSMITLLYIFLYLRLSGISNRQSFRIISFYFYYGICYLFLFLVYMIAFFVLNTKRDVK